MREIQELIVKSKIEGLKYSDKATGGAGLKKTEFIKSHLIPNLNKLIKKSDENFFGIEKSIKESEPITPIEIYWIKETQEFLNELKRSIPDLDFLNGKNDTEKVRLIEERLRTVVGISRKFHDTQKYVKETARKVIKNEISPLLKKMYLKPELKEVKMEGKIQKLLTFTIKEKQLRKLEKEAEHINQCQDEDYKVTWRKWWQTIQQPETDKTTPLKDAHINLTLKLFGESKKDIHLLLAN